MTWDVANPELNKNAPLHTLDTMPDNWDGKSKAEKVQIILDVVEDQMRLVRNGLFDSGAAAQVAALALEGQMTLVDFYADSEASARNAKHIAEYIESEVCDSIAAEAVQSGNKRPSEAALKRKSLISDKVREARKDAVELEKEHKKWRYVMDILKEAHVFFRRLSSE